MTTLLDRRGEAPRYIANDPRPSLIGMTRNELASALAFTRAVGPEPERAKLVQ